MSRLYQRSTPALQLEHSGRTRDISFGYDDGGGNADLIALYGIRPSSRDLERARAAVLAPTFLSANLSRKRSREDEADLDRERLQRHRKLSGIDSSPSPLILQAFRRDESHDPSGADYRRFQVVEDEHEDGQLTPPLSITSQKGQDLVEYHKQLFRQYDGMVAGSRKEGSPKGGLKSPRFENVFSLPSFQLSPPKSRPKSCSSRPSSARGNGNVLGQQFETLDSKEQSMSKRDNLPSPRLKDNERALARPERVTGVVESSSLWSPDLSDKHRRVTREPEIRTRSVSSKAAERGHDAQHFKMPQQVEDSSRRVSRSLHTSRKNVVEGLALDSYRFSKEQGERNRNGAKRKTSKTSAPRESRHMKEMTISVQKCGQRTVKVGEYKPRDTVTRAPSQTSKDPRLSHRGGGSFRDAFQNPLTFCMERERMGSFKKRDSDGRPASAVVDKGSKPKSLEVGLTRPQHQQRSRSQEHALPSSKDVKNELLAGSGKFEVEPQRNPSIFSRLVGYKPESTSANLTTIVDSERQNSGLPLANDRTWMVAPSKNPPNSCVTTVVSNGVHEGTIEIQGVPVPTRDSGIPVKTVENGSILNGNSILEKVTGRLNKDALKCQVSDRPKQEESCVQQRLDSVEVRFPNLSKTVFSSSEKGLKDLQFDPKDVECPVNESTLLLEETAEASESRFPLHVNGLDTRFPEVNEQSPGSANKIVPKVISTGHRKDQAMRKNLPDSDLALHDSPLPPLAGTGVVSVDKAIEGESEGRALSKWIPVLSGCEKEVAAFNPQSDAESDLSSRLDNFGDKLNKIVGSSMEPNWVESLSVGLGTSSYLCQSTAREPSESFLKTGEPDHITPVKESEPALDMHGYKDNGHSSVIPQPLTNDDSTGDLQIVPKPISDSLRRKEIRLFGANLNASVAELVDLRPEPLEMMVGDVGIPSTLQVAENSHIFKQTKKVLNSAGSTERLGKVVLPTAVIRGEQMLDTKGPVKSRETSLAYYHVGNESLPVPETPVGQGHFEELPVLPRERHVPPPYLQKVVASVQGRSLSSSHSSGARTWRRDTSTTAPANSASMMFRGTTAFTGLPQPAGRASGRGTAYVRKGNSLVRASGVVPPSQPANDGRTVAGVIPVQVRPVVRLPPTGKSLPFRNPFTQSSVNPKTFHATHSKYTALANESGGVTTMPARIGSPPNVPEGSGPSVPHSSIPNVPHSGISDVPHSCTPYTLNSRSASVPLITYASVSYSTGEPHIPVPTVPAGSNSAPQPPASKVPTSGLVAPLLVMQVDQEGGVSPSIELPVTEESDANITESAFSKPVEESSQAILCTSVMSTADDSCGSFNQNSVFANRLYVRRKANQLIVAPPSQSIEETRPRSSHAGRNGLTSGLYFKRKINQLVRSNVGKGSSMQNLVCDLLGSHHSPDITEEHGGGNALVPKKMKRGRVLRQKKGSTGRSSWVWTLGDAASGGGNSFASRSLRTGSLLFPWKRQNSLRRPAKSQRLRPFPEGKKGSLLSLMSKRLRRVRPVQPVYTRSADGFSLRRSGVMSLGGGNLKWTKSLERRAKQASEAATKAVAEAERIKREKKEAGMEAVAKVKAERRAVRKATQGGGRIVWVGLVRYRMDPTANTLQRIADSHGANGDTDASATTGLVRTQPLLTPRRSIIGGNVYLKVGNGNQLIRDPKAASRALASEKVRWSLHNARSRGAKKQQYCQFFTKFGKCNKESGKCPYIHDRDKVAVCTKFLKGNCTDARCLLTHKVIPERMPDCSFFLEGLCTNENCPYRHVNVNPKASYCEGFLRGYCKDGDKCNKKHTYVCSVYAETGECMDRSSCKFHHPKKRDKKSCLPVSGRKIGAKRKRTYFPLVETNSVRQKILATTEEGSLVDDSDAHDEGSMDFISLNHIESDEDQKISVQSQPWLRPGAIFRMNEKRQSEDVEQWIRPTFLLRMTSAAAAAAH